MKTKNNIQKTGLWLATVVVSLFLISYTVSGQSFWGSFLVTGHSNEIAMAMNDTKKNLKTSDYNADNKALFLFKEATDPTLDVEDWMHSDKCFGVTKIQIETEIKLEIKEWMLEDNLFWENEDYESPLKIEAWMVTEEVWET